MKMSEFKAWFEGFCENIEGRPTEKQFAKIKERVAEIDDNPVNPVVLREYVEPYRHLPRWAQPYAPNTSGHYPIGDVMTSATTGNTVQVGEPAKYVTLDEMKTLGLYDSMMS